MGYKTVTVDVDVDVELDDFSDNDLVEELQCRGYNVKKGKKDSWESSNKPSLFEEELDNTLWRLRESYIIDNSEQFRKSFEKILAEFGYFV
jgi:hypothetical protein